MTQEAKRVFNVLFIAIFTAMLGLGIVGPLLPIYAQDLGATGIWLGIIFASFSLARAIFMPIIGKISDKTTRKKFITYGLLAYSIISLLYLLANSVVSLTIIRFLHGIASAMVIPIALAYVGETTEKGKEGSRMGLFNIAFYLGMGTGPLIGGVLHDAFGMSSVFIAMSVLTGISFLLTLFLLPDISPKVHQKNKKIPDNTFKALLKNKLMVGLVVYRFINALGRGGTMSFLPVWAAHFKISPSKVGIILSTNIFFMALLQGFFGKLADKFNKFVLVVIGASIGALALLFINYAKNFWSLLTLVLIMGLGGAISMPAASAINVKIGRNYGMGATSGLFSVAMSLGMIFAPLISGAVMNIWGLKYIFIVAGILSFIGIAIFVYFIILGFKDLENHQYK